MTQNNKPQITGDPKYTQKDPKCDENEVVCATGNKGTDQNTKNNHPDKNSDSRNTSDSDMARKNEQKNDRNERYDGAKKLNPSENKSHSSEYNNQR